MEILNNLKIGDKVKYTRFIPFGDEHGNKTLENVGFIGTIEDIQETKHDTIYHVKYFCEYAQEEVTETIYKSHLIKGYDKQKIEVIVKKLDKKQIEALTNDIYNTLSKQATKKDIVKVIEARQKSDYTQAHKTNLYKNKGGIYCRVLELIN